MKDKTGIQSHGICTCFTVGGIALSPDADEGEAVEIVSRRLRRAGMEPARLALNIFRRSVDARRKNDVRLVYSVAVTSREGALFSTKTLRKIEGQVTPIHESEPNISFGTQRAKYSPLVVGMGPAGLFCALMLAENGYRPVLIDRGDGIHERCRKKDIFFSEGVLDTESNVQFGAGGAGTFSDGKLVTRIGDGRVSYVFRRFCDFGAPEDIRISAKPHIGTDLLVGIVDKMLNKIEELGGTVLYRTRLTDINELPDGSLRAKTTNGDIFCSSLVLATGHSARDIYSLVMRNGYSVEPKAFSVGVRIEHLQSDIDKAMYGDFAGHPRLGAAEYHLSDTSSGRGVYTFCMCPGGEVVCASSEEGSIVVNGMSRHARDGKNANSAVLVSVRTDDFGFDARRAIELQETLEERAFCAGGGAFYAPFSTVGDFLGGTCAAEPSRIMPTYRGGRVRAASLEKILPPYVTEELKRGLISFDKKVKGFSASEAILTGVETRSSAPIRILRTESLFAPRYTRVYPCGEGAGYAGGITSAAIDGIRVAERIMARFAK